MKLFVAIFILLNGFAFAESFEIAVLADCQYCNQPDRGKRMYKTSDERLKEFVKESNKHELKFAIQLGDLIDKNYESYEPVLKILGDLKTPIYHVLGNHDFDVSPKPKSAALNLLKIKDKYYSMKVNNYRFIVLDGNDLSFHAYEKGSEEYKKSEQYYQQNKIKSPRWNGALSEIQMNWLEKQLKSAEELKENAVLFCHFPIFPKDHHNLWNDKELKKLLEKFSCVKAYVNGHNHKGNYAEKNGIHYMTMKGMVENVEPTFSIMELFKDQIKVKGYGAEPSRELKLKK